MRILVIEDNSDIAANLGDYLEECGHTVDFAADGITGLHLAIVHDFDAIVLDLNLPGMDGLEVCRKLRNEARKQTPVLMLTARDSLDNKLAGFDSGADDYLIKPFALQEVNVRLNALARRGRGLGRLAGREQRDAFDGPFGRDRREADRVSLPCKKLGERLHQFLIVAARGAHGNAQRGRPQEPVERARGNSERENARREDQKRIALAPPSPAGNPGIVVRF